MPIAHKTRLYAVVASIRPLYRYACTCVLTLLILWTWHATVYTRMRHAHARTQQDIVQFQHDYRLMRVAHNEQPVVEKTIESLRAAIKKYSCSGGLCMSSLIDIASNNKVTLMACTAHDSVDKEWYTTSSLSLGLQGSLRDVAQFFDALATAGKLVSCDAVQVSKAAHQNFMTHCEISIINPKIA